MLKKYIYLKFDVMWYKFHMSLVLSDANLNVFNCYSARLISREVLCFYLISVFKQIGYYYYVDLMDVLFRFNVRSIKNIYLPIIYYFDVRYYLFLPITSFFTFFRVNMIYMIYWYYRYFFIFSILLFCKIFFFNLYIYMIFFFRKYHFFYFLKRLRYRWRYKRIYSRRKRRKMRYYRLWWYVFRKLPKLERKKYRLFRRRKLRRRLLFVKRIVNLIKC